MTSTSQLDMSLNTSKKSLFCNHCMYDLVSFENMKEHYKTDFHKYNLNRVTNNLNPLNFEEFTAKKDAFIKMNLIKEQKIQQENKQNQISTNCLVCKKTFSSGNKMIEHLNSKVHLTNAKKFEEKSKNNSNTPKEIKNNEPNLTTLEDNTICMFCNVKNESLESNILHMTQNHKFEIPMSSALKREKAFIRLLADKIFKYNACLTCDNQNFGNYRSLQNHMIDTNHTKINCLDLEEFLFKYYDLNLLMDIKDRFVRKTKEYSIIKIKLLMKEKKKNKKAHNSTIKEENQEDGWETASDEEDKNKTADNPEKSDNVDTHIKQERIQKIKENLKETDISDTEGVGPIVLPNGELLLENGIT